MSAEEPPSPDAAERRPHVHFDLDKVERQKTGDPVLDRGLSLTLGELEAAEADPSHPDHEAAKAASAHLSEKFSGMFDQLYGEQFRRISRNLAAAARPDLSNLFPKIDIGPSIQVSRGTTKRSPGDAAADVKVTRAVLPRVPASIPSTTETSAPETLRAMLEVSEHMSEMVRVAVEHRDVALQQTSMLQAEAESSRRSGKQMFWIAVLGLLGTWVAVVIAVIALT